MKHFCRREPRKSCYFSTVITLMLKGSLSSSARALFSDRARCFSQSERTLYGNINMINHMEILCYSKTSLMRIIVLIITQYNYILQV